MSNAASLSSETLPDNAIEIAGLGKTYSGRDGRGTKRALDNVSLNVRRGSFFALLGPNGAGKSTLINIMAGLIGKTDGSVHLWGYDIVEQERAARMAIGIVPQELNFDPFFSPREILEVQAGMYGVPKGERRTEEILKAVGLADKAEAYTRTLSGGMKRRLLVAKAMVHSPPILVLDEPTAGVDIDLRRQLWEYVQSLNDLGATILLTTHYLEEAQKLCDTIAIIDKGKLIACEPTPVMLGRLDSKSLIVTVDRDLSGLSLALEGWAPAVEGPRRLRFTYRPSRTPVGILLAALRTAGFGIVDLSTEETDLEDVFLRLTRHSLP